VLQFCWHFELTKFSQNLLKVLVKLWAIFHLPPELFPYPPPKISWEITYYALLYFHFCRHFEIIFFAKILNMVEIFWKDSIFSAEFFLRNFSWNIDEIFGAATLVIMSKIHNCIFHDISCDLNLEWTFSTSNQAFYSLFKGIVLKNSSVLQSTTIIIHSLGSNSSCGLRKPPHLCWAAPWLKNR